MGGLPEATRYAVESYSKLQEKDSMTRSKPYLDVIEYYDDHIAWLRLRVTRMGLDAANDTRTDRSRSKTVTASDKKKPQTVAEMDARLAALRQTIDSRIRASLKRGVVLPLESICDEFGVDSFDKMIMVLLLAPSIDSAFAALLGAKCSYNGTMAVHHVMSLLCDTTRERIAARRRFTRDSPLVSHGLIRLETGQSANEVDFLRMDVHLSRPIASRLLGDYSIADRLVGYSRLVEPLVDLSQVVLPPEMIAEARRLTHNYETFLQTRRDWGFDDILPCGKGSVLLFSGPPGTGKTMLAHALAKDIGRKILSVNVSRFVAKYSFNAEEFRNVFTEAKLRGAMVFFDDADELFDRFSFSQSALLREFEAVDDLVILATNKADRIGPAMERRILCHLRFVSPTPSLRREIWERHLPPQAKTADDIDLDALSNDYNLSGGYIKNAVLMGLRTALAREGDERRITHADLAYGARSQLINAMRQNGLEDVKTPMVPSDEVMLRDETKESLSRFIRAGRDRQTVYRDWGLAKRLNSGRSLTALFSGPSGTGKTMAAEAVAYELGQELLPVSPGGVVSKYVGETAGNLKRLFARARASNLILFFDEAESFFSARRGGNDANSFFINQDIGFLLAEMERHDGIIILATNHPEMLDEAFERRLKYRVRFEKPDRRQREAIWRRHLPKSVPLQGEIDFKLLAREYALTGGSIRNVVLKASFMAAAERTGISMSLLREAAREEKPLDKERRIGFSAASA
jgi:SpoVK/Ycf46/Vps4 family AAA+-type ATPase